MLTSIPIYYISFFKAPIYILNLLKKLQRHFVWGGAVGWNKRIAWVSWEVVCNPKEKGGLGIKDLEKFNLALLGGGFGSY